MRGLTLQGSVGYTDNSAYKNLNPILVTLYGPGNGPQFIPKWTANGSAQYESEPLFGDARFLARVDAIYTSRTP